MFLEVLFVRSGLYFFENTVEVSVLDIIAYCAYLFVPKIISHVSLRDMAQAEQAGEVVRCTVHHTLASLSRTPSAGGADSCSRSCS